MEIFMLNIVEVINVYVLYLCVIIMDRVELIFGYNFVEIFRCDFFWCFGIWKLRINYFFLSNSFFFLYVIIIFEYVCFLIRFVWNN